MKLIPEIEFSEKQEKQYKKAKLLSWISIVYLLVTVILFLLVLGQTQIMKTELFDTALSLIPPISFLISSRICWRKPNEQFPYGYHRASSIAFLCASLALLVLGIGLMIEAIIKLIEHPPVTISDVSIGDFVIWEGWLMIGVLVFAGMGPAILGQFKIPIAKDLHDKTLYTDAQMNKADWLSNIAAILGIIGIGFFKWSWADGLMSLIISFDIFYDGFKQFKRAIADLADRTATTLEGKEEPIIKEIYNHLCKQAWIGDVEVRLREHGHLLAGTAFVKVKSEENLLNNIEIATNEIKNFDWRVKDFFIVPVKEL